MTREEMVEEARTWIDTPYVLHGALKGAGVDCATFIAEVLIACKFISREEVKDLFGFYSGDWFLHTSSERYLFGILRHARRVAMAVGQKREKALPGCLALYRVGTSKVFNHGSIITRWPMGIHAESRGVKEVNLLHHRLTMASAMELFDPFAGGDGRHI